MLKKLQFSMIIIFAIAACEVDVPSTDPIPPDSQQETGGGEPGTCRDPDECYGSSTLKTEGLAKLNGQLLRWSQHATNGKGETQTYGHWYKDGQPDVHLVDSFSNTYTKTTTLYVDVSQSRGRANNGLYYTYEAANYPDTYFNITSHNQVKNAEHCNWMNVHMNTTNVCVQKGMRLPRLPETSAQGYSLSNDSCSGWEGAPEISGANGVPNFESRTTWTATASISRWNYFWYWSTSVGTDSGQHNQPLHIVCVAP